MDVFCRNIAYSQYWGDKDPSPKCCSFAPYLEFGDLQKGVFSKERFQQFKDLLEDDWTYDFSCLEREWAGLQNRQKQILAETETDGFLYIWHDRSANDALTFRYLCRLFKGKNVSVYSASPEDDYGPLSWAEIEIDEYENLRKKAVLLSRDELETFAEQWNRVAESESVFRYKTWDSVDYDSIDHFDAKIRSHIPATPFRAGQVIGNLIGECHAFDAFLPFVEKRLSVILRSDFEYEPDDKKNLPNHPYLYQLTFTKMKKGIRLFGGEYSKRLESYSLDTLRLMSKLNASTKEKALKMSDITTNGELSEEEVVKELQGLLSQR